MLRFRCFFPTLLLASLAAAPTLAQTPESTNALVEHTPHQVLEGNALRVGHYSPEKKLRLTLAIQPPHMAEEEQFLRDLTDFTSPSFHKFLTPEEWNARFAPSAEDEQAVVDWAISQGLTVTHRFNHRLLVDLEGTSGVIEKAFGVTINNYRVDNEVDFSNDRDPAIPARLSRIIYSVQGLNNIQREHNSRPGPQAKAPDYVEGPAYAEGAHDQADARAARPNRAETSNDSSNSTLFTNGYANPTEIFSSQVYNYDGLQNLGHCCNPHNDSGGTPSVSNVAIAAFGNFNGSDVTGFQAAYPYLAYSYTPHYIDGSINCTANPGECPSGETTQDVEWVIATANSFGAASDTAKVFPYIGANFNNGTFTDMYGFMLSDNLARVFTTSWSCTEVYGCSTGTMDSRHSIFNSMVGQGWTIIAASGDRGSSDDCYLNQNTNTYYTAHESVAYPGSDYDVLSAGGTQLLVYSDGTWDYEHGWQGGFNFGDCGGNDGGSGGGVSSYYTRPGFQGYSTWTNVSHRQTPDISLNALGIGQNLYINGKLQCCANGTSIVAPELAGFFAQENAYLNSIGSVCGTGTTACTPVGEPMQFFYPAAFYGSGYVSHFPFYDMVGNYCNDNDVTVAQSLGYYCSKTGWDNVTGWGSANMLQLAWAINWYLIPASGSSPTVTFSGPATSKWYNSDQQISWVVKDPEPSGSTPSSGVAGFTQGWDSMPPDSFSKPHGGTGDTFWSGPEYPNFTNGCMTLVGNPTCPGGVTQGCHTAHVRGWNNQGWTTGEQTYGPICYDTVVPTISVNPSVAVSSTGWFNSATGSPNITFVATDPGGSNASGVKIIYGVLGPTTCLPTHLGTCQVYGGPFGLLQGTNPIIAFSEDNAGNFSSVDNPTFYVDTVAPATTVSLVGSWSGGISLSAVTVHLTASDATSGVKTIYYTLDGGSNTVYSAPFVVSPAGSHTLKYWSVDYAGNTEATNTNTFAISSPTTATLVATPNPSLLGNSVTMTATIKATLPGSATPTGSVTFLNGATNLGTRTLSSGVATLSTTALPAGLLTLQASYLGATYDQTTNSVPFDQTVQENTTTKVASSLNPSLYGQSVTFTAQVTPSTSGTPTGSVKFYAGATLLGTMALNSSDIATFTTTTLAAGSYAITAAYSGDSVYLSSLSSALTQKVNQAAALTSPTPGSTLTGTSATFTWSAGTGVTEYEFRVGTTGPGSKDVVNLTPTTALTTGVVNNIPAYGATLYARLYSLINGAWQSTDYTYTESGAPVPAELTSPTPGSTLTGTSATFTWSAGGGVSEYEFRVGTTGPGSKDVVSLAPTTALTTGVVSGIPAYGVTLYARLYSLIKGTWVSKDYTYTESGTPVPAELTSPTPGSTLTGTSATFAWSAGGGVSDYELRVGTTGPGSKDVYSLASTTALTTGVVSGIPAYGVTLYVRLYSLIKGAWVYKDFTYTESGAPVPSVLTSPSPGSTLTGTSATFTWSAGGGVSDYEFRVGTTGPGSNNVYNLNPTTALTSGVVSGIPAGGATLYARLYSLINGAWQYKDYTYTEAP